MGSPKKRIYPNCGRENYNVILYADVALRNYARVKEQFESVDFSCDDYDDNLQYDLILEYSMITILFSTMCIEAFLNDYAAACLGDKEFYGNFDKLSIDGKFALIGKFVLSAEIDKGQSYFFRLKTLIRERNELTHSKSKEIADYHCYTEEPALVDDPFGECEDGINPAPYKEMIKSANNAILAVRDIALFFDMHDASAHAIARMFGYGEPILDKNGNDVRNDILRELGLKRLVNQ